MYVYLSLFLSLSLYIYIYICIYIYIYICRLDGPPKAYFRTGRAHLARDQFELAKARQQRALCPSTYSNNMLYTYCIISLNSSCLYEYLVYYDGLYSSTLFPSARPSARPCRAYCVPLGSKRSARFCRSASCYVRARALSSQPSRITQSRTRRSEAS